MLKIKMLIQSNTYVEVAEGLGHMQLSHVMCEQISPFGLNTRQKTLEGYPDSDMALKVL